ncbi:hypothetical protein CAPN006_09850 [Capnocytophaga canimorsus]|uniref:hypothetical protein n=1 Tax=Capnocytophaga canimorsus TaxID=28188 RepID=UPI001AD324CE|nr:hypothetical protein [Capnocytophaga canimorsus]GIM56591.1 hypothetical protein CAPN006_09850 [Capnocytophaga canimorsus]
MNLKDKILVFFVGMATVVFSQIPNTSWENNLIGKVKLVTEITHDNGSLVSAETTRTYTYDSLGYLSKYTFKSKNSSSESFYTYDENGNEIEKKDCDLYGSRCLYTKHIYNSLNELVEYQKEWRGYTERTRYEYNSEGVKEKEILYTDNALKSKNVFVYDDKGRKSRIFAYSTDNELKGIAYFNYKEKWYDKKQFTETRIETYPTSWEVIVKVVRKYGKRKNVKKEFSNKNRYTDISIEKFNRKGKLRKKIYITRRDYREQKKNQKKEPTNAVSSNHYVPALSVKKSKSKMVYKYDRKGNLTMLKNRNSGIREKSKYIFDNQGNWIKRITIPKNGKAEITERTIAYYP